MAAFGLSFYGSLATASSKIHPHAEYLKDAPNPRLTITRYSGLPDFNSQQSLAWSFDKDGLLRSGRTVYTRLQEGWVPDCETLMGDQQFFSLSKMVFTEYLKEADIPKYIRLGESFETGQVNFALRSRDIPFDVSQKMDGYKADKFINHLIRDHDSNLIPRITASSWSVAGQMLDPFSQQIRNLPLPWQKDPDRKELAAKFDRKKYPVVFEWGRTAQDLPGEAEVLAHIWSAINYQETKAMGYKLEDAWVMFHSFDVRNTRAYSFKFPGSLYPQDWKNKEDALFLVPLSKVLEGFPPSHYSAKLKGLVDHGKLDEVKAIDFLLEFNRIQFTQLDIRTKGRDNFFKYLPRPLALRDTSDAIQQRWYQLIQKYGLENSPTLQAFADHFMGIRAVLPNWNSGQYTDVADMDMSVHSLVKNNAIEISNLDRAAAKFDSTYVTRMLFGAFIWYVKSFAQGPMTQEWSDGIIHKLHAHGTKVAMTTFDPVLMEKIRALKPESEVKHRYDKPEGFSVPEFRGQEWLRWGYENEPITFYFTVDQIIELANMLPQIYKDAFNAAEENLWARYLMLTNPDVF